MSTPHLRFMTAETIESDLAADPELQAAARTVREMCDRTHAALERVHQLDGPEHDRAAGSLDSNATAAAGRVPTWVDPGTPNADQLAADRAAAVRELDARGQVSDQQIRRWVKLLRTRVDEVVAADEAAVATAGPRIVSALEKLRPQLLAADVQARRARWLRRLASEGLDFEGRKYLAPERMPDDVPTLVGRLDAVLDVAHPGT